MDASATPSGLKATLRLYDDICAYLFRFYTVYLDHDDEKDHALEMNIARAHENECKRRFNTATSTEERAWLDAESIRAHEMTWVTLYDALLEKNGRAADMLISLARSAQCQLASVVGGYVCTVAEDLGEVISLAKRCLDDSDDSGDEYLGPNVWEEEDSDRDDGFEGTDNSNDHTSAEGADNDVGARADGQLGAGTDTGSRLSWLEQLRSSRYASQGRTSYESGETVPDAEEDSFDEDAT